MKPVESKVKNHKRQKATVVEGDADAKEWAIRMSEKGYAYKTIDNYKRSLKASFYMAYYTSVTDNGTMRPPLHLVLHTD